MAKQQFWWCFAKTFLFWSHLEKSILAEFCPSFVTLNAPNIQPYKLKSRDKTTSPWFPPNQTRFSTPNPSQIPLETYCNWGRTAYVQGRAIRSEVPNKEGANIRKYVRVEQFRYYPTSSMSSAPNFLKPIALDSPGECLPVSTKFVQNPRSRRGDIGKTR